MLAQVGWTALCERELTADDYENEALPTLVDASAPLAAVCCWRP
ncbi:MAG: hypothetical protein ACLU37_01140 [Collinsella sp.]